MAIAPRVAQWLREHHAWPGSNIPSGAEPSAPFPQSPLPISVALRVDNSWLDITPFVYGQERSNIRIVRGRADENRQVEVSHAESQINNRDGQFSPRNPMSPLFGKIGRNTLMRVMVGAEVRFMGEISEWPQRWDSTGSDVWVPIEASGILRRFQQGNTPLKSAMYRGMTSLSHLPIVYWPCEDGTDATEIASAIGGTSMTFLAAPAAPGNRPDFASHTAFRCSAPLPTFNRTQWTGVVPDYIVPSPSKVQVTFLTQIPTGSLDEEGICAVYGTGSIARWSILYDSAGTGNLRIIATDDAGTELLNSSINFAINGKLRRISLELQQDGADVDWALNTLEVGQGFVGGTSGTISSQTLGRATAVVMNAGGDHTDIAVGHISVHDEIRSLFDLGEELNAFAGETAGRRLQRLCIEEGFNAFAPRFDVVGGDPATLAATATMGPQLPKTLVDLLRECEAADGGILYEPRATFGLIYRTREQMYNQPSALELDYAAAHLSELEPTDDDQQTRNDITAQREGGASFRVIEESGPLSVLTPPNGVGTYDDAPTLNVQWDGQLPNMAGWLLHLGTVDEARFPVLSINLGRPEFDATLVELARRLDVGERLTIANPPAWLPPGTITQLAQGFTEVLAQLTFTIAVNCSPESPWGHVGIFDSLDQRYDTNGSELTVGVSDVATSLSVATLVGPVWTSVDGNYDIVIGGERMTVTLVTGGTSPQTFTVTRSVNGVVKSHLAGATVELADPAVYVP